MKKPKTPEEWQSVFDAAVGLRAIADCKMFGLLQGGPDIDLVKIDAFIAAGERRGLKPSRPVEDLVPEIVAAINEDAKAHDR